MVADVVDIQLIDGQDGMAAVLDRDRHQIVRLPDLVAGFSQGLAELRLEGVRVGVQE